MNCQQLHSLAETYLDGELDGERTLGIQLHSDACERCRERLALGRSIRESTRRLVQGLAPLSPAFEARLRGALLEEKGQALSLARSRKVARQRSAPVWGIALAIAAAAAVWLGLNTTSALRSAYDSSDASSRELRAEWRQDQRTEDLLDRLIDYHSSPPARLVQETSLVPQMERDIGVRVAIPSLINYGAKLQGGSVVRMYRGQRVGYLRYRTEDKHSVTLYVYDASRVPLHAGLNPRLVASELRRDEPIYVGHRRGYSIAASHRDGVGYAVATDLDDLRSAELVREISFGGRVH